MTAPQWPRNAPVIFQMNTSVLLHHLSEVTGREMDLADIPDSYIKNLADLGFNCIYALGVWTTSEVGLKAAQRFMQEVHPRFDIKDVVGSPFAVKEYVVSERFGGDTALQTFRSHLRKHGLSLILDFVPNHVALDHRWVAVPKTQSARLEDAWIIPGHLRKLREEPQNYFLVVEEFHETNEEGGRDSRLILQGDKALQYIDNRGGDEKFSDAAKSGKLSYAVFAHGRDPHFDGWRDTAQLNYFNKELREAVISQMQRVSKLCDAVRCDMANLIPRDVLNRTWRDKYTSVVGHSPPHLNEFWGDAICAVKAATNGFRFIAEAYWNMERQMITEGFDFCYDKSLYDHLKQEDVPAVSGALRQSIEYQSGMARFLENHDEERAATAFGGLRKHAACMAIAYMSPGMKFFHQGQLEGRVVRIPVQLSRYAEANPYDDSRWVAFDPDCDDTSSVPTKNAEAYRKLLRVLKRPEIREGELYDAEVRPSKGGSQSHLSIIAFFRYRPSCGGGGRPLLVVANLSNRKADGWVRFPDCVTQSIGTTVECEKGPPTMNCYGGPQSHAIVMNDIFINSESYRKNADEVKNNGVWVGLHPWHCNVFELFTR